MSLKITNIKVPIVAGIITLLAVVVMVKLGFWQLDRAAQKQALFDDYQQHANESTNNPVNLNLIKRQPERFEAVTASGTFDQKRFFFIDNQIQDGTPGYHVVGLLKLSTKQRYLPVNLGWIKAPRLRSELPQIELPDDEVTLTGLIQHPEENVFISSEQEQQVGIWPQRVPEFLPEEVADVYQIPMLPYVALLSEKAPFGYSRQWQPNVMPPEKHQAYALQWFSLAIAALVIFAFAVIKINKQKQEE